ncbi:MAG: type I DNA topoisomerase [Chloroflexota bacterium]
MAERNLVVVESAAKAKTIEKFLGRGYTVRACLGHVRDLPKSKLGVDVEHDFMPAYVDSPEKRDVVKRLRDEAKSSSQVYIATDPDREGEAIAWHLVTAMKLGNKPVRRIEFHEVTKDAVLRAVASPRDIDLRRVDAQQARRVLDRLVGYKISPLLWKKVRPGLSAGRVQSVAVRLVVDRERERDAFQSVEYWSLHAELAQLGATSQVFKANLNEREGHKIELHTQLESDAVISDLEGARYQVREIRKREQQRHPTAPFTTSTLQQEASRKLGFTARRTMVVAQQLYEGIDIGGETVGLITYMRTDSVNVAISAVEEARDWIRTTFDPNMVPAQPRTYRTRSRLAQEAHEAIRPTAVAREPAHLASRLDRDQLRLYELVWKRFVASQMSSAIFDVTSIDIDARADGRPRYGFRATGSVLRFRGFLEMYLEGRDDGEEDEDGRQRLPELTQDEQLRLERLLPEQHFTQPPPRYTEATLVKALEERGIGRPSTYAPILSTIQDRGYVEREDRRFKPTEVGYLVNDLLMGHFANVVDLDFTANLEGKLDDIATGDTPWVPVVREFYEPFEVNLDRAQQEIEHVNKTAEITDKLCEKCGKPMAIKLGKFGRFLSCTGFPQCRNATPLEGEQPAVEPSDEICETCAKPMVIKTGRYGKFLSCSDYPTCKTTRPILVKLGVGCPVCGTDLVEKRSRFGKTFYGCSAYPACSWLSWQRPLPEPCDICGKLRFQMSGDRIHCLGCDGELPSRRRAQAGEAEGDAKAPARRRGVAASARSTAGRSTRASAPRGRASGTGGRTAGTRPSGQPRRKKAS